MARGNSTASSRAAADGKVGPPLLILGLGYAAVLVSLPLISADGVGPHVVGYLIGGLLPILVVGLVRRIDLDRRRSAKYKAKALLQPALVVLMILAMFAALFHIWPIATELAQ